MKPNVIWLEKAKTDYSNLVNYLKDTWGNESAKKFIAKVEKQISTIVGMPKILFQILS